MYVLRTCTWGIDIPDRPPARTTAGTPAKPGEQSFQRDVWVTESSLAMYIHTDVCRHAGPAVLQ